MCNEPLENLNFLSSTYGQGKFQRSVLLDIKNVGNPSELENEKIESVRKV